MKIINNTLISINSTDIKYESVKIPKTVTTIAENAFYYQTEVRHIKVPASVTTIELAAFRRCHNLETITFQKTDGQIVKYETICTGSVIAFVQSSRALGGGLIVHECQMFSGMTRGKMRLKNGYVVAIGSITAHGSTLSQAASDLNDVIIGKINMLEDECFEEVQYDYDAELEELQQYEQYYYEPATISSISSSYDEFPF